MITAKTLAKSGIVLLPPADPLLGGGVRKLLDVEEPSFGVPVPDGEVEAPEEVVPAEELDVLEPLMSRRFGGGGGAVPAPKLEELGESSRVDGAAAVAAAADAFGFGDDVLSAAADAAFTGAFGLRGDAFTTGFEALDFEAVGLRPADLGPAVFGAADLAAADLRGAVFRGVGFWEPCVSPVTGLVAPVPPSLSASLTVIPRQHRFRFLQHTPKQYPCIAPHAVPLKCRPRDCTGQSYRLYASLFPAYR